MTYYTIYTSTPRVEMTLNVLNEITEISQKNNQPKGITGILLGIENKYLQYLEGPEDAVNDLFKKIWKDGRHQNVTQWIKGYTQEPVFKDWSMGSWMLTNEKLKNLSALADLKKFLEDPLNTELASTKFVAMMNDLLRTWIEHEPERAKKMRDSLSNQDKHLRQDRK